MMHLKTTTLILLCPTALQIIEIEQGCGRGKESGSRGHGNTWDRDRHQVDGCTHSLVLQAAHE